jgi:hypothetical protein
MDPDMLLREMYMLDAARHAKVRAEIPSIMPSTKRPKYHAKYQGVRARTHAPRSANGCPMCQYIITWRSKRHLLFKQVNSRFVVTVSLSLYILQIVGGDVAPAKPLPT